jgi:DNA repair protein RecO (recombination protein O)
MPLQEREGIVLKTVPYQDNKRIISVFTDVGILQLIVTLSSSNTHLLSLTTPLSHALFLYQERPSQLHLFKEGSLLSSHLAYQTSYEHLETAMILIQTILSSQFPGKSAPLLYQLLHIYLKNLPHATQPKVLASSFMLKTLRHEGLLAIHLLCGHCQKMPSQALKEGSCYCQQCMPRASLFFETEEWDQLLILLTSKKLQIFKEISYEKTLHQKVQELFKESFS